MGLQDVFFALRLPFDSRSGARAVARIAEEIYLTALEASADLAAEHGPHPAFGETRAAAGELQLDLWGVPGTQARRWSALRKRIAVTGLRNSPADRDRADRDDRLDSRMLRVHRAAGLQPVQARDHVGRVHADQRRAGGRAEGARACGRPRSGSGSSGPRDRCRASPCCPQDDTRAVTAPRGNCRSAR